MNWVDVATHNEWQFYNETGIVPVPKELRGVDEMLVAVGGQTWASADIVAHCPAFDYDGGFFIFIEGGNTTSEPWGHCCLVMASDYYDVTDIGGVSTVFEGMVASADDLRTVLKCVGCLRR